MSNYNFIKNKKKGQTEHCFIKTVFFYFRNRKEIINLRTNTKVVINANGRTEYDSICHLTTVLVELG